MPKQSINTLKNWFKRGLKPLEVQFADWLDSYWHKDATDIPVSAVQDLQTILNGFATTSQIDAVLGEVPTPGNTLNKLYNLIAGISIASFPDTYFVSPDGNDTTGTKGDIARPFTPAGAAALAVAGDTIAFMPGEYNISSNIAKSGVNYTTFGGAVYITNNTPGLYLFNYEFSGVTIGATISGDFHFILNSAGGGIIRCHDAFGSGLTYTFKFATADVTDGNFVVLPRTGRASLFEGSVNISGGIAFRGTISGNVSEGLGSSLNFRISSTSIDPVCSFNTRNYKFDISFLSETGALSDNGITSSAINNLSILKVNQPSGKTSYLPQGAISASLRGGQYIAVNGGKFQLSGEVYNCTLTANSSYLSVDGYFDSVVFYNNQATLYEIDGVSNNCSHAHASSAELTIIKGKHYDIDFGSSTPRVRIEGQVHLLAGTRIVANNILIIAGLVVADVSTSAILVNTMSSYVEIIGGKIKNKNVSGTCITNSAGFVPTLRLDSAKLFSSNGSETILVNTGSGGGMDLELLNKSYANVGITNSPTYIFEPSGNYFVDADVTIQEI